MLGELGGFIMLVSRGCTFTHSQHTPMAKTLPYLLLAVHRYVYQPGASISISVVLYKGCVARNEVIMLQCRDRESLSA